MRDGYHIHLRSGVLHLLAPLDGVTFGAVFLGEGEYRLEPSTESERRHLQLVTDDDELETLSNQFDRLWLLFTDQTAQEVLAHAAVVSGERDPRAAEAYEDYRELQRDRVQINLQLRIVSDRLGELSGPVDLGRVLGVHGRFDPGVRGRSVSSQRLPGTTTGRDLRPSRIGGQPQSGRNDARVSPTDAALAGRRPSDDLRQRWIHRTHAANDDACQWRV